MRDEAPVYYSSEYDFYAPTRHATPRGIHDFETYSSAYGVDLAMVRTGQKLPAKMIISDGSARTPAHAEPRRRWGVHTACDHGTAGHGHRTDDRR